MTPLTAMQELGHIAGWADPVLAPWWRRASLRGEAATGALRALTGDASAELHADTQHFWPYGLSSTSEVSSDEDLICHCRIVDAMQLDLLPDDRIPRRSQR